MRNLAISLAFFLSFPLWGQFKIEGCVQNLPDSITTLNIAYLRGQGLSSMEEISVDKKGCFSTTWSRPHRGIFVLFIDPANNVDFLISEGDISIKATYGNLNQAKIAGPGQKEFEAFKKFMEGRPEDPQVREYVDQLENEDLKGFLLPQLIPFQEDQEVPWLRAHFWDHTNLESPSTLINPFFASNRKLYFDQVLGHHPDTVIFYLKALFEKPMNEDVKRTLVGAATAHYESSPYMGEDKVFVYLVNAFYKTGYADWVTKDDRLAIIEKADGLASELIGMPAPDFAMNVRAHSERGYTQGQRVKLSEIQSPITILYFWDATCGHCRKETPKLKAFYDEYKDKGVEVIAVTLENEFTKWEEYIQRTELTWINAYESDFERPNFLWYYYIPSTPKKLILNEDKIIIGKNLDTETTLRTFIDDYLEAHPTAQ